MRRSVHIWRGSLLVLGLLGAVACTDRLVAPEGRSVTPRSPGFDKREIDIGDGTIFSATLKGRVQTFDAKGKLVADRVLPGVPVSSRIVNGTAMISLPTSNGGTSEIVLAEALHGKYHKMRHHEKAMRSGGHLYNLSADGDKNGGPMTGGMFSIDGTLTHGTTYDWERIDGGWVLQHSSVTTYGENGRPASVISFDVSDATVATLSVPAMYLGDATRGVKQAGGAFAKIVLPPLLHAQPMDVPGWVEAIGVLAAGIGVIVGLVVAGPVGIAVAVGMIALGTGAAVGALLYRMSVEEDWFGVVACWTVGPNADPNCTP
jgi:hypothetical protein